MSQPQLVGHVRPPTNGGLHPSHGTGASNASTANGSSGANVSVHPSPQTQSVQLQQQQQQVNDQHQSQSILQKMQSNNADLWLAAGKLGETMGEYDRAITCFDAALKHSPYSIPVLSSIANIYRSKEMFGKAIEFYQTILNLDQDNGETWGSLGHCYLMMDDLQKAYSAYQQALYHLRDPKDPKLWYGIGILYDRYGSLEYAEEAFSQVMEMDPNFEKANEIYFRLGIIYKQQLKYPQSLECFRYILQNPPRPLTEVDIWFQIGHVHEQQKGVSTGARSV